MAKHYVITGTKDWADEFYVHFFDIMSEDVYRKYMAAKEILGKYLGDFYFGSNEGWEDDFDYLDFEPQPITDEQYEMFCEFGVSGVEIVDKFLDIMSDVLDLDAYECPLEDFKAALYKYKEVNE